MIFFSVILASVFIATQVDSWNYADQGPDKWPILFTKCNGKSQSPINIMDSLVQADPKLQAIVYNNYDVEIQFEISVVKYSVELVPELTPLSAKPFISGSNFGAQSFPFVQCHFHWGPNEFIGSEHLINNKPYSLEMHLVHKDGDNIAVTAFLFELDDHDNPDLNPLIEAVNFITGPAVKKNIKLNLSKFLPLKKTKNMDYYRYSGSLTTPECTEGVTWSIFKSTIPISKNQLSAFRKNGIPTNFRAHQKINGRTVHLSDLNSKKKLA